MIALKKINKLEFVLNADLIETIETTPDTRIKLSNGKSYIVSNSVSEVVKKVIRYKQICNSSIAVTGDKEEK